MKNHTSDLVDFLIFWGDISYLLDSWQFYPDKIIFSRAGSGRKRPLPETGGGVARRQPLLLLPGALPRGLRDPGPADRAHSTDTWSTNTNSCQVLLFVDVNVNVDVNVYVHGIAINNTNTYKYHKIIEL